MKRLLFLSLSLFIWALVMASPGRAAEAQKRVALVVGNAAYEHSSRLVTPPSDVRTVSERLRKAGFLVIEGIDLTRDRLVETIRDFLRQLDKQTVSLFYYSGHAVQVGNDNFLIPIDAKLASAYDLEQETFNFSNLMRYMENLSSSQLIFLDACRDNPFKGRNFITGQRTRSSSGGGGLAPVEAGVGTLVAFSTAPGSVAFDGEGELSPFSGSFANHVLRPNTEIGQLMKNIRREVLDKTKGLQLPWERSALVRDFYFVPPRPAPQVREVHQVEVSEGQNGVDLGMPMPIQREGGNLRVSFTKLPEKGRLLLDGRPVDTGQSMTGGQLASLRYDAGDVAGGDVAVTSYRVTDDWGNEKSGIVVIKAKPKAQVARAAPLPAARRQDGKIRLASLRSDLAPALVKPFTMPIGVGPVRLNIKAPKEKYGRIEVVRPPQSGLLELDGRQLVQGASFDISKLAQLSFRPDVASAGKVIDAEFAVASFDGRSEVLPAKIKPEVHECDRLAGQPFDLQGVAPGVFADKVDGPKAKVACLQALADYPATARFLFQMARAELALGNAGNARQLLELAAKKGHIRADHTLGKLAARGAGGKSSLRLANTHYKAAALSGDVYGHYSYGKNLFHGRGVKQADRTKGLAYMLQAAEMGHTFAMNELSYIFREGVGVKKDPERAMRFSMASALRDDIYGFNNLAIHFLNGSGVAKDFEKALAWFLKAHKGGHPEAANNIGRMYQNGWGVPRNDDIAAGWYEKSALRGSAWASLNRAWYAVNGPKRLRDNVVAARYYALAASLGDSKPSRNARQTLAGVDEDAKRRAVQTVLGELGYNAGAPDGRFGAGTRKAIGRFVKDHDYADTSRTDALLVSLAKAWWLKNKPRFDLF